MSMIVIMNVVTVITALVIKAVMIMVMVMVNGHGVLCTP